MIGMAGEAIVTEGQNLIGLNLRKHVEEVRDRFIAGTLGKATVWVAEEALLLHAQARKRRLQLSLAERRNDLWRPPFAIAEARLASRHVNAHDAVTAARGVGHETAGDEHFVVGMCPDSKDGAHCLPISRTGKGLLVRPPGDAEFIGA